MVPIEIPDAFGGHLVFPDHVEPVNMPLYHRRIRERAMTYLEDELWRAIHVAESRIQPGYVGKLLIAPRHSHWLIER